MTTEPAGLSRRSVIRITGGAVLGAGAIGAVAWWATRSPALATLRGHVGPVRSIAVHSDGALLASSGDDGTIRIWDTKSNRELHRIEPGGRLRAVAFGPGTMLASSGDDALVKLWDAASGEATGALSGAKKALECVAVSSDGERIVAAGIEGAVYFWQRRENATPKAMPGHAKHVHAIAFTPDGKTVISGGEDGSLRFWDGTTGAALASHAPDKRHTFNLVTSSDGKMLLASASGKGVKRWSLPDRKEMPPIDAAGMIRGVAISPDGRTLATVHEDGAVKTWDAETAAPLESHAGHQGAALAVAFSADGTFFTAGGDGTVKRWRGRR
ncbi:MAG: WD40 repeat domain-containing protein [Gemmataceae bacterium]